MDTELAHRVKELLEATAPREQRIEAVLRCVLEHFDAEVGTIHRLDPESGELMLAAHVGLPEEVRKIVERVPVGKGMAGLAAERRRPVQVCNLQTDESGQARPGARETRMQGSITVPAVLQGRLHGTLGVGMPVPHEFSEQEQALLLGVGELLAAELE